MLSRWGKTRLATVCLAAAGLSIGAPPRLTGPAEAAPASATSPAAGPAAGRDLPTVDPANRDRVLPAGWRSSPDVALSTAGDASGLHVLVAAAKDGYTWRTVATLSEPGLETDRWVGNACLTGSATRAVVVYAPRLFTNRDHLYGRGAFAAVVDLVSGRVRKLRVGVSLAYYNPGCGVGETAVLTQAGSADLGRTRLHLLDATRAAITRRYDVAGQVDSAVPVRDQIVAATGNRLFSLAANGGQRTLALTRGAPAEVHSDGAGGIAFLDRPAGGTVAVNYLSGGSVRDVARGPVTRVGLAGSGGRLYVTGVPDRMGGLPASMRRLAAGVDAGISSHGGLAVTALVSAAGVGAVPVGLQATVPATGSSVRFQVSPEARVAPAVAATGRALSPARPAAALGGAAAQAVGSPTDPFDADRTCSIPRNDPRTQVEQPHWKQVEWAADLAVQGALTVQRPANWNSSGLPAWSPQGMFPPVSLTGGGANPRVPAQVLLGILAQESNLAQASWHVLEGETGNPLVGNYYGIDRDTGGWGIDWSSSDCGYGVGQVTDGMRLAGHEKPGETALSPDKQKAVAVDYATNIAASLRILQGKWNQVRSFAPINDADPENIENWFAAAWAYNSGLNPQAITGNTTGCTPGPSCTDDRGNWGLGWGNNPANPTYSFNRHPFLNGDAGEGSPEDAATPQNWPYPEKVVGFAAFPIVKYDFRDPNTYHAGYAQAWWTAPLHRTAAKPPLPTFCSSAAAHNNHCTVGAAGRGACSYADLHCWWHWPAVWKPGCQTTDSQGNVVLTCGFDTLTYAPGTAEPADGTHWPPVCSAAGLPGGALIVDDQPDTVPVVRSGCGSPTANTGTFGLTFDADTAGHFPSKVDFHQIGGGLDAHLWFAHTYTPAYNATNHTKVTGTWALNAQWFNIWGRVLVHVPGHGVGTQQADYTVDTGGTAAGHEHHRFVNTKSRYLDRRDTGRGIDYGDHWVSLGVFNFAGTPKVKLSNITRDGDGSQDIAWDAVAFQKLTAKPRDFVVGLGDSYASGEGASQDARYDYYRETDADGTDAANQNGCHRSRNAWLRQATLADQPGVTLGSRADNLDNNTDLHFLACSGAESQNVLYAGGPTDGWGRSGADPENAQEVPQLEAGYLDDNTTLVMLSIGGNDAGFSDVVTFCVTNPQDADCQTLHRPGDPDPDPLSLAAPRLIQSQVRSSIGAVLTAIHQKAPNAKVILAGYPRLIDNTSCLLSLSIPGVINVRLSPSEGTWLNQMADQMAITERDLVASYSAFTVFADPRVDFTGYGVCSVQHEGIHGPVLSLTGGEPSRFPPISQQSFHPKIIGAELYASTVIRALRTVGL